MTAPTLDDLRRGFAARRDASAPNDCPDAEQLFAATQGELPADRVAVLADHALRCAECAEAWRLALELAPAEGAAARSPERGRRQTPWGALAAAAMVVLAVGLTWQFGPRIGGAEDPVYRDDAEPTGIELEAAPRLPRDRFLLRWRAPTDLPGARYTVRLVRDDLSPVLVVEALTTTSHLVPAQALAAVPDDSTLLWQVDAQGDDGRVRSSSTAEVRLGAAARGPAEAP